MASFGRSCEKLAGSIADFGAGLNQRLDENHIVDMMVTLKDEDITVEDFQDFTKVIKELRSGKKVHNSTSTATTNP